jgi:hypothetical protein
MDLSACALYRFEDRTGILPQNGVSRSGGVWTYFAAHRETYGMSPPGTFLPSAYALHSGAGEVP